MSEFWNIFLHVAPILFGIFMATLKIAAVIKNAISSEVQPVNDRLSGIEERMVSAMRDLWEHNASQDLKIDTVMSSHYRLVGAHDALTRMRDRKAGG